MTSPDPSHCESCGRQRWAGDRFCAGCGAENTDAANGGAPLIDLDNDVAQTEAPPAKSSRRESVIGVGALLAVLGLLALFFIVGNDAAEELANPANPFPTGTPTPVPTATPEPEEPAPSLGVADNGTAETEPAEPVPTPTPRPVTLDLVDFVTGLALGEGWIIVSFDDRLTAVDLETGETLEVPITRSGAGTLTRYALRAGVVAVDFSGRWTFEPWQPGSDEVQSEAPSTGGQALSVFSDPTAGPLIITMATTIRTTVNATSLLSGESREVEVADPANALLANFVFYPVGLIAERIGFLGDDGTTVFSWTWDDGWSAIASGQLALVDSHVAAVTTCSGLTDCPATILDLTGTELATVESGVLPTFLGPPRFLSPDLTLSAGLTYSEDSRWLGIEFADLNDGSTSRIDIRELQIADQTLAWSPTGDFVLLSGELGLHALHVATGEITTLELLRDESPNAVVFLDDIDY